MDVPAGWGVGRLRWLAQLFAGGTPSKDNETYWTNGTVPWLNSGSVNQFLVTEPSAFITEAALQNSSAKWIPRGALVMALAGQGKTKGMVAQLALATTCNQSMAAIVPGGELDSRYLLWWLTSNYQNIRNMAGGDDRDGLNLELLGNIACPLPPVQHQKVIALFLDRETSKIDALVEEQKRLIELLKEKRRAVISHAVTKGLDPNARMKPSGVEWPSTIPANWEVLPLTRVVSRFVDYRGVTPTKLEEGVPLITATQIKNGKIDHSLDPVFISENEYAERMTRGFPEVGDVLVTTEAPLGEVAMIEDPRVSPGQRMILMKVNSSYMTHQFLFEHFRSDFGKSELQKRGSGSTATGIRADRLRASLVLVPPTEEQLLIVQHIRATTQGFEEAETLASRQIELLQERRSSLISSAVTGKIKVSDTTKQEEAA